MSGNISHPLGQNARRELFLWAIFIGRFDLGRYLCSKTWVRFLFENVDNDLSLSIDEESISCGINRCTNISIRCSNGDTFGNERRIRKKREVNFDFSRVGLSGYYFSQFDHYAMSIIDQCFDSDEQFAVGLLKENAAAFDNLDPLKVAQEADCRIFLASKCVQRYLDNNW